MKRKTIIIIGILFVSIFLSSCGNENSVNPENTQQSTNSPTPSKIPSKTPTINSAQESQLPETILFESKMLPDVVYSKDGSRIFVFDGHELKILNAEDYSEINTKSMCKTYCYMELQGENDEFIIISTEISYGGFYSFDIYNSSTLAKVVIPEAVTPIPTSDNDYVILEYSATPPTITPDQKYVIGYFSQDRWPLPYICRAEIQEEPQQFDFCYQTKTLDPWNVRLSSPAVSNNGKTIAAIYSDQENKSILYLWDMQSGNVLLEYQGIPYNLRNLTFSPDDSKLLGFGGGGVYVMDAKTGKHLNTISGFKDSINAYRFTNSGDKLIITFRNYPPLIYDFLSDSTSAYDENLDTLPYFSELEKKYIQDGFWVPRGKTDSYFGNSFYGFQNPPKVVFSPDEKNVAYGAGNIQIWDINDKKIIANLSLNHDFVLCDLAYSPNGKLIGGVTSNGAAYIWDTSSEKLVFEINDFERLDFIANYDYKNREPEILEIARNSQSLTFSLDSKYVALQNGPTIEIWSIEDHQKVQDLQEIDAFSIPTKMSFSQDGKSIVAVINENQDVAMWNNASGNLIKTLGLPEVDDDFIIRSAFNSGIFVRSIFDNTNNTIEIEIWDIESGSKKTYSDIHTEIETMKINDNGEKLIINSDHQPITILNLNNFETQYIPNQFVYDWIEFDISPSGNILSKVDYDGSAYDFEITGFEIWNTLYTFEKSRATTPIPMDSGSSYDLTPTIIPIEEKELTPIPQQSTNPITNDNVQNLELVADIGNGNIIRVEWSGDQLFLHVFTNRGYYLMDAKTLDIVRQFIPSSIRITDGRALDNGQVLICGTTRNGEIEVYDISNEQKIIVMIKGQAPILSPDGSYLVFSLPDGFSTYDFDTGKTLPYFAEGMPRNNQLLFSNNQQYIAQNATSSYIQVNNLETGNLENTIVVSKYDLIDTHFSQDSNYLLAAAGGSAYIMPIDPDQSITEISIYPITIYSDASYYQDTVTSIDLNPDATIAVVGTSKQDLFLYDVKTTTLVGKISASDGIAEHLYYSPDGLKILEVDSNSRLILWNALTGYRMATSYLFGDNISDITAKTDGNIYIVTQNMATTINQYDGEILHRVVAPAEEIFSVSPAGNYIAGYTPIQVSLYNARDGSLILTLPEKPKETNLMSFETWKFHPRQKFYGADFSLDGNRLVTFAEGGWWVYDQGVLITDIQNETVQQIFTPISKISQDGTLVLGTPEGYLRGFLVHKAKTGEYYGGLELGYNYLLNDAIEISPDKKWVGFLRSYSYCSYYSECEIDFILADPLNGSEEDFLILNMYSDSEQTTFAFNQSTTLAAVAHSYGEISIVSIPDMEIIYSFKAHSDDIVSLAFSIDDSRLISADENGIIRIWAVP